MKLAYVVIAHKNFPQVRRMIDRLDDADSRFAVVVDARSPADDFSNFMASLADHPHVHFLPRAVIEWGQFSLAKVAPDGMSWFLKSDFRFDYVFSITGQDYPLARPDQIREFLQASGGKSFILHEAFPVKNWGPGQMGRLYSWNFFRGKKVIQIPKWAPRRPLVKAFYAVVNRLVPRRGSLPMGMQPYGAGGGAHWTLSREAAEYVDRFVTEHPEYDRRMQFTLHADEVYVQTILANSPLKEKMVNSNLRYTHWPSEDAESPSVFTSNDFPTLLASGELFARKFDMDTDAKVLDMIDERVGAGVA